MLKLQLIGIEQGQLQLTELISHLELKFQLPETDQSQVTELISYPKSKLHFETDQFQVLECSAIWGELWNLKTLAVVDVWVNRKPKNKNYQLPKTGKD